jgi:peptidoglycan/LPS O-acetylase OafA/YrhL
MSISNIRDSYRPDIDGLRAIAVTSVILFHSGLMYFSGGFVGVDVFFAISGYLITAHIYKEINLGNFSFATFYSRRAKRIIPALLLVVIFSLFVSLFILSPREISRFSLSAISAIFGASNLYYWYFADYFAPSSDHLPMLMTWSLGVEEQFYAFFPILLLVLVKYCKRHTLAAVVSITVVSFLISIVALKFYPLVAFYMLPARAWELGLGSILAIYEADRGPLVVKNKIVSNLLSAAALLAIASCVEFYSQSTSFPGAAALPAVLGATVLIALRYSIVNSAISFAPIVFVGRVSYSWYLWHWPLLAFARVSDVGPLKTTVALVIVTLAFALAVLTYYLVEQPFRKSRGQNSRILLRYATAIVCVIVPLGLVFPLHGLPWRFASSVSQMDAANGVREQCLVQYGETRPNTNGACELAQGTRPAIALLGDSHAAALAEGLRKAAGDVGYDLLVLTKVSCPSLGSVTRFMPNHPGHDAECAEFNKKALSYVTANSRVRGVILVGYWSAPLIEAAQGSRYVVSGQAKARDINENTQNLESGLVEQMKAIQSAQKSVLVVQDVPIFDFDPVMAMLGSEIPARKGLGDLLSQPIKDIGFARPSSVYSEQIASSRTAVQKAVSQVAGAKIYDPSVDLCADGVCKYANGSDVLYIDNQHLSHTGADLLATAIVSAQVVAIARK